MFLTCLVHGGVNSAGVEVKDILKVPIFVGAIVLPVRQCGSAVRYGGKNFRGVGIAHCSYLKVVRRVGLVHAAIFSAL